MPQGFPQGDARAVQAGAIGGTKSGYTRRMGARVRWAERFPGIDPVVAAAIYRAGFQAGWRRRKNWIQEGVGGQVQRKRVPENQGDTNHPWAGRLRGSD